VFCLIFIPLSTLYYEIIPSIVVRDRSDLPPIVDKWGGKHSSLGLIRAECILHAQDEFAYLKDIEDLGKIIARFVTPTEALLLT